MKISRLAVSTVAVTVAFGLGACGPKNDATNGSGAGPAATAAAPKPASPVEALDAAMTKNSAQSAKFKMNMLGITMTGESDPAKKLAQISMNLGQAGMKMEMRQVGTDMYMQMPGEMGTLLGAAPGKWMHIDTSKLPASSSLGQSTDTTGSMAALIKAANTVKQTAPGQYEGTLDFTKTPNGAAMATTLGEKAKAVPFTAKADGQGRITNLTVDMSGVMPASTTKGQVVKIDMQFYDFGTPVAVSAPAASQVTEMPDKFLKAMTQTS